MANHTPTPNAVPSDRVTTVWVPGETRIEIIDTGHVDLPLFPHPNSPGHILTARQHTDLTEGRHPLTGGPLHRDAPTDVTTTDRYRRYGTCGDCVFLTAITKGGENGGRTKTVLKCGFGPPSRITKGHATDVRRWWSGCADYQTGDQ